SVAPVVGLSFKTWPVADKATKAALPAGSKTTPYGCEARGSGTVCTTVSDVGSIMLIVAAVLFVTQMRPLGATATLRGAVPTATSALVTALRTVAVSLSWLTTHRRLPAARGSQATVLEPVGRFAVSGRCTVCTNVRETGTLRSSIAVTVTKNTPGCVNV